MRQRAARGKTNPLLTMRKKKKENKEKKLFLNKENLRLLLKLWQILRPNWRAQSAIPSSGKESGKESADSAKTQSDGALKAVMIRRSEEAQRLKDENADLKRRLEALEEKHKSSPVRKSTISKCHFE